MTMRIGIFSMIAGSVLCFCISLAAVGQTAQQTRAGIVDVEPYASISVEFDVQAADKQLVIPVCGHVEDEKPSPCVAHVQRFDGRKWYFAKSRHPGAVLGFLSKEYWKPLVISPGKEASFRFGIDQDFFGIRKGERLRIVLEVWASSESMATNDTPDSKFVSPVFVCP